MQPGVREFNVERSKVVIVLKFSKLSWPTEPSSAVHIFLLCIWRMKLIGSKMKNNKDNIS